MTATASTGSKAQQLADLLRDLPPLLTINGVAELLTTHSRTVRRWLSQGRLHAVRAGSRVLVARSELARFLAGEATA